MSLTRQADFYRSNRAPVCSPKTQVARLGFFFLLVLPAYLSVPALAATSKTNSTPAYVAIIIDDLGNNEHLGKRAAKLPGPVACAILPHTRFAKVIADTAHKQSKEVLLHLPMQSSDDHELGPGNLLSSMPSRELRLTLGFDLESIPYVSGINNHMGSQFTRDSRQMDRFMRILSTQHQQLFFVDSLTTPESTVAQSASKYKVPYLVRDIFLDNERTKEAIESQFDRLLRIANRRGYAIGIGHPYRETLAVLERRLPELVKANIQIISLSTMLSLTTAERQPWQLSSSH